MAKISQDKLDYSSLLHGKYELGRLLGHGTFAKVYHARNLRNGRISKGRLREDAARSYFQQLISAVEFCHSRGIYGLVGDTVRAYGWILPFQDDNLIAMYKKIYRGDFKCPPWFSPEARRVVCRLLDPNPNTRITISKLKETSWFKKSKPKNVQTTASGVAVEEEMEVKEKVPEALNAFHIISLSEGFDLSPLFEEKKKEEEEEMRFATLKKSMSDVVLKLEELTKPGMFPMTPALGGDSVDQYNQSCGKELRPAVEGIGWTATQNSAVA
ncbi:hypothetical protein AAG906_006728 [Vitis piasezkii]